MNKFALTTVAALPGSGGGYVSKLAPEISRGPDEGDEEDQSEGPPTDDPFIDICPLNPFKAKREDFNHATFVVPPEWEDLCKQQAKEKREAMTLRLGNAMTLKEYEAAWDEIDADPELSEYFSHRN